MVGLTKVIKVLITFIKFKNKGTINKSKSKYNRRRERDSFKKPYLRDGDIILLVKSFLKLLNHFIKEFTNSFIVIILTYGLIKAISD